MGGGGPRIGLPDGRLSPSAGERSNGNQTRTMRLLVEVTREGKRDADTGTFACGAAHLCDDRTVAVGLVIVVAAMCAVRNGEGGMIGAAWADSRVVAVHLRRRDARIFAIGDGSRVHGSRKSVGYVIRTTVTGTGTAH